VSTVREMRKADVSQRVVVSPSCLNNPACLSWVVIDSRNANCNRVVPETNLRENTAYMSEIQHEDKRGDVTTV
jgi:hypothetical protein